MNWYRKSGWCAVSKDDSATSWCCVQSFLAGLSGSTPYAHTVTTYYTQRSEGKRNILLLLIYVRKYLHKQNIVICIYTQASGMIPKKISDVDEHFQLITYYLTIHELSKVVQLLLFKWSINKKCSWRSWDIFCGV